MSLGPALLLALAAQADAGDLRGRMEQAAADGWERGEVRTLSAEVLDAARHATSRGSFLGALGLAAELCRTPFPDEARTLRAEALALLAQRDSDTLRWSTLVLSSFVPDFASLPPESWADELAAYDGLLDDLAASDVSGRARAELASAKVFARVELERNRPWLDEARRGEALELLAGLRARFGDALCPGADGASARTIGERAERYEHELTRLAFGAVAPPTGGIDLDGEPLDLGSLRGRVVVLDFWTTFCQPCLALVPTASALLDELADEPITYVGVCGDTDRAQGRATAMRVGMPWRNLWDGPLGTAGPAATTWNVNATGWPTVFVLDGEGRIRAKLYGQEEVEARLEGILRRLLAEER